MAVHTLNGIALCAGAGGLELGLHIAEPQYRTVCYVEREAHAAATLVARMEDQALDQAPVWDDVKTFRGRPWRGRVDIITAGYPCQPFSSAGRRKGVKDPRHLWPSISRIIDEARPRQVFLENVPHHLRIGFPMVARDLRRMDFRFVAGLFSARETGAPHFRRRLFILAHADRYPSKKISRGGDWRQGFTTSKAEGKRSDRYTQSRAGLVHTLGFNHRYRGAGGVGKGKYLPIYTPGPGAFKAWHEILRADPGLKPTLPREGPGVAGRLDRLRLSGNGVCPLAAAIAYRTLRAAFNARKHPV